MAMPSPASAAPAPQAWWRLTLTQQILLGLVVGCLVGLSAADKAKWADWFVLTRDIFLHLIKAMIAPLVFASVVQGIAGTDDMKKVGRIGAKALLYFAVVTTAALAVGLPVVNVVGPGVGVKLRRQCGRAAVRWL